MSSETLCSIIVAVVATAATAFLGHRFMELGRTPSPFQDQACLRSAHSPSVVFFFFWLFVSIPGARSAPPLSTKATSCICSGCIMAGGTHQSTLNGDTNSIPRIRLFLPNSAKSVHRPADHVSGFGGRCEMARLSGNVVKC